VFAAYRKDDFADPESYLLQLGTVLERYDDEIVEAVTSPISGIQRECKFPPSIAEFVEFCNETRRRLTFESRWKEKSEEQLAEREELERQDRQETTEHRADVVNRALGELKGRGFQFRR
jgi:hypothetical protein